ncbi:MAG: NrdR family transcriptional regulator [Candidatus Saccharibacteria bacterium]|nr:NrdR family transcriptional regulator [Candidatus Saccharibacteria bacterium]
MVCPYCAAKTEVVNSRLQKRSNQVWRRRQCRECKSVFTTHEAIDLSSSLRVSTNGELKPFISDLLFTEVLLALQDRKDCYTESREVTGTIIQELLKSQASPVFTPKQISEVTAGILKRFNQRAWHRYTAEHPSQQA